VHKKIAMMLVITRWSIFLAIVISLRGHAKAFTTTRGDDLIWKSQPHRLSTSRDDVHAFALKRQDILIRGGESTSLQVAPATVTFRENGSASSAYSYYLLWSPGFATKFALTSLGLTVLHLSGTISQIGSLAAKLFESSVGILPSIRPIGSNIILPLLSSSCCLIQLVINLIVGAGGCAGFNTALGPFRPVFLSLLAFMTFVSKPGTSVTLFRSALAMLPELVHFWNRFISYWRNRNVSMLQSKSAATATLLVDIPTMGCVACVNKIDSSLRQCAPQNIQSARTWLDPEQPKGGKTQVNLTFNSEEEMHALKERILLTLEEAGFGGSSVVSVESSGSEEN
jgi:hypothetical protein